MNADYADMRAAMWAALELVCAREATASVSERGWLSMVRGQLNNAMAWSVDAERDARADAERATA